MIVFVHIERTGGSKIHDALMAQLPEHHVIVSSPSLVEAALDRVLADRENCWYLGGHVRFAELGPFLRSRRAGDTLFSSVRAPIDRALSLYFFALQNPSSMPALARIAQRSFAEFYAAASDADVFAPNAQCRFLANTTDLAEVRAALHQHYDIVGVHHRYKCFCERLQQLLLPSIPGLRIDRSRINAAYHQLIGEDAWERAAAPCVLVDAATRRRIERDNQADCALVEFIGRQPAGVLEGQPFDALQHADSV